LPTSQIENPADLVGTWRLVAYIFAPDAGDEFHPYGEKPTGLITYTADGFMHVAIMNSSRSTYEANDFQGGCVEQQAAAARSYLTYSGRYEVLSDRVLHIVEISLLPNRSGITIERYVDLNGDRLTLTTPPMSLDGSTGTGRIIWQRAGT
jgi:hypothetical protein